MDCYYNRAGQVISREEWASKFEDDDDRRVAETTVGIFWVSTVFLGLNHAWGGGPPLIFETMVFNQDSEREFEDVFCERYSTEEEALAGHKEVVARLKANTFTDYVGEVIDPTYVIKEEPTLT